MAMRFDVRVRGRASEPCFSLDYCVVSDSADLYALGLSDDRPLVPEARRVGGRTPVFAALKDSPSAPATGTIPTQL